MFGSIGMPEMIIILVIALIVFGPRKLPELGKSLGRSINEFKKASNELRNTLEEEIRVEESKEQRAKMEADQKSAVAGAEVHTTTPSPVATPPHVEDSTVSRTGTGHPA
jgi:sec-independent protein translocase protein TatA